MSRHLTNFIETPDDPRHGTPNGYNNLGCRCVRCTSAWSAYFRVVKAGRSLKGPDDPRHGTANGYGNYNCRCRDCTDAWSAASLDRVRRRKMEPAA